MDNEARRATLRQLRNSTIEALDPAYPHAVNIPGATYAPWRADADFTRVYELAKPNTLVDIYRCYELWSLVSRSVVPGDILEVGTWRGGTGALLAAAAARATSPRAVFLCDTFEGVVKASGKDTLYKGGEHADTSESTVVSLLQSLALDNAQILRGTFPDQTGIRIADRSFALCHIDVDVYASARDIFEWVLPRLSLNGLVVFDDYGFLGCEGITRLVDELTHDSRFFSYFNLNGHAVMIKLRS